MEKVECIICGQSTLIPYKELPDYLLDKPDALTTLVRCANCKLVFQNPRPTIDEMAAYYPPDYECYYNSNTRRASWFSQKANSFGYHKRCRIITRHKKSGQLLDVGCATGFFLREMAKVEKWQVQGVEINPYASSVARTEYNLDVFTGTLEQADFPNETYDAVTLWDVLEHVHTPLISLHEIHRILKPGGIIAISVPNLDSFDAKLFGDCWAGFDAPRHLYVFDKSTATRFLTAAKFRIVEMNTDRGRYSAFLVSLRFWMTKIGLASPLRQVLLNVMSHPLSRAVIAPLSFISSLFAEGPVLTIVAMKDG